MSRRRNLTLAMLCASAQAAGSPRSDPTTGRAVWTGATEGNPTSITLDPAAIGQGTATETYLSLTGTLDQVHVDRSYLALDGSVSPGPTIHAVMVNPGATAGIVWHTSDRITIGGSFMTPPSESFIANRDALRYMTLGGGQSNYLVTVGASLKVADQLYVGASLAHDITTLRLHYSRDTALDGAHGATGVDSDCGGSTCGLENPNAAENYDVSVRSQWFSTDNLRVNLGVMVELAHDIWLGVAYHPPPGFSPIQTDLSGSMDVRRSVRDGGEIIHGSSTVYVAFPAAVDAEVRAHLQHDLELHVGGRWEDLSRFQGYDVRGYGSTFAAAGIPEWTERARGFHDSFAVWGGVEQADGGERWRFGARLGYETESLSDNETTPISISPTSLTLDLGAQLRINGAIVLQLSYGLQAFERVKVGNSAFDPRSRIDCIDSGYDYSTAACAATRNGYGLDTADGTYSRLQHAMRFGFKYDY
jgi:hypothetical protein